MKKKKTQTILTRIFACILVVILALGIIAPVVASATELLPPVAGDDGSTNESSNTPGGVGENGATEGDPMDVPSKLVSTGFEWKKVDGVWTIQKVAGNTDLGVIVDGLPLANFDAAYITFFIGNLETHDVIAVETMNDYSFTKSVSLDAGYYVLYANNYAFSDSNNNKYAVEGGKMIYFHIGEGFDANKYPVKFVDANVNLLHLNMEAAPEDYTVIKHNQRVTVTSNDLTFPESAAVGKVENGEGEVNNNTQQGSQNNQSDDKEKDKEPKEERSLWKTLKNSLSRSALLIVGIIACFIATTVIKSKKKASLEEQAETDRADDGHIL